MTTPDDPDLAAAELALGLLDGDERAAAMRRVLADQVFAREVDWWRAQFATLYDEFPVAEPPESVARDIGSIAANANNEVDRWRWLAAVGSLAAAVLLVIAVAQHRSVGPGPAQAVRVEPSLVAVIAPTHGEPFGATVVPTTGVVRLGGGVAVPAGRAAELWAIGTDGVPRAAGLLTAGNGGRLVVARGLPLMPGTTLAISIEPAGGSPKQTPTGPVVATGKLVAI